MTEVWLNVAEKNSVAKEVARVLSGGGGLRNLPSSARFNPVFDFAMGGGRGNLPHAKMLFTSVSGHLESIDFEPRASSWATYPIADLFTAAIVSNVKDRDLLKNLQELSRRASTLVLWLDCDREGERIAFEVMNACRSANQRLRVRRAHFSALTERDLFKAVTDLREPNKCLSDAVELRQEMDLRIGSVFTRFQCLSFRDRFQDMPKVMSYGPCQLPCLTFVVEKFEQREAFVPEQFYHLEMRHVDDCQCAVTFKSDRGNIFDLSAATLTMELMLERANAEGNRARVLTVDRKSRSRFPPAPLATVEMQKLVSRHLRINSERCMQAAEELYQQGYISYPRTETDSYTYTDEELQNHARAIAEMAEVADYAQDLLGNIAGKYRRPRPGGHDDKAHPPIHPLKPLPRGGLHDDHKAVYLLIVRHFLASMSKEAVAAETVVGVEYGGEHFSCSGLMVLELNWLAVFVWERWTSSASIPRFGVGDSFPPVEVVMREGTTTAPTLLTEAALIGAMDANGIGTDATIAAHIKTIQDRRYVVVENGTFRPTPLGVALVTAYEKIGMEVLTKPQQRAQMELAMNDVAQGRVPKQRVLAAAVELYRGYFQRVAAQSTMMYDHMRQFLTPVGGAGGGGGGGVGGGGALGIDAFPLVRQIVAQRDVAVCGICGTGMTHVTVQHEAFTRNFARCDRCAQLHPLPGRSVLRQHEHGMRCPICQFGVVQVTNTETNKSHHVCSNCFGDPPIQYGGGDGTRDIESAGVATAGGFRCFMCTHPTCALAQGSLSAALGQCPACNAQGSLTLRRTTTTTTTTTNYFIGCRGYPTCKYSISLPPCVRATPASGSRCGRCGMLLLTIEFTVMQLPTGLDPIATVCVFCDAVMRDYITVKGGGALQQAAVQPKAAAAGAAPIAAAYVMPDVAAMTGARGRGGRGGGARGGRGGRRAGGASMPCTSPGCQAIGTTLQVHTVRKEGPNHGKKFVKCDACGAFKFIDDGSVA